MTQTQIINKLITSKNFQRKAYAEQHNLTGHDHDETVDNVALHLGRQDYDFISAMYEACYPDEVDNRFAEKHGLQSYQMA
jgi:hypothetical protein